MLTKELEAIRQCLDASDKLVFMNLTSQLGTLELQHNMLSLQEKSMVNPKLKKVRDRQNNERIKFFALEHTVNKMTGGPNIDFVAKAS